VRKPGLSLIVLLALTSCALRDSLTDKAESQAEWSRRLARAVPIGVPVDSAAGLMRRHGFDCVPAANTGAVVWCDKQGAGANLVRRRWRAGFRPQDGRVVEVLATTGLIGP
jgi:hypothetical protein